MVVLAMRWEDKGKHGPSEQRGAQSEPEGSAEHRKTAEFSPLSVNTSPSSGPGT